MNRLFFPPRDTEGFRAYVKSLRALRLFQHSQFQKQNQDPQVFLETPRFYESKYDPNLAKLALEYFRKTGDLREFEDQPEKLDEIAKDRDVFENFISAKFKSRTGSFGYRHFYLVENILPPVKFKQDVNEFVATMHHSDNFFTLSEKVGFRTVLAYVPKEDVKHSFETSIRGWSDANNSSVHHSDSEFLTGLIKIKNLSLLYSDKELHELAKDYIENNTDIWLHYEDEIKLLVQRGILDQSLLEKIVFQTIKGLTYVSVTTDAVLEFTPNITKEQFHDAFIEAFQATTNPKNITNLRIAGEYLTEDEKLTIAKRLARLDPNIFIMNLYECDNRLFSPASWFELLMEIANNPQCSYFGEVLFKTTRTPMMPEQKYLLFKQLMARWEAATEKEQKDNLSEEQSVQNPLTSTINIKKFVLSLPEDKRSEAVLSILVNISNEQSTSVFYEIIECLDGTALVSLVEGLSSEPSRLFSLLSVLNIYPGHIEIDSRNLFEIYRKAAPVRWTPLSIQ